MAVRNNQLRRRVIIGATCFADADTAISMAANLAKIVEAEILGLLVEDESILTYADLPFAKTLTYQRGAVQPVTRKAMDSAFQRDARTFERRLASAADQTEVNWSFEHKRGQMMSLIQSEASAGDFIFLGYQQTGIARGEIVFIDFIGNDDALHLLDLSKIIANEMKLGLQTINLTNNEKLDQETGVLDYLRKTSPAAVIVAIDNQHNLDLLDILETARCPVILYKQDGPDLSET